MKNRKSPVYSVKAVPIEKIQANTYNPNHVAPPEMKLLYQSIKEDGYTMPIVCYYIEDEDKYEIVDGYHRYTVMLTHKDIYEREGGMLATPPQTVEKVFKDFAPDASCASWAVKFAADLEGVLCVLSGMSSVEQMADNLSYMKDFAGFSEEEKAVLAKAREELDKIDLIQCTACNYCAKTCPANVSIAKTLYAINCYRMYGNMDLAKHQENMGVFLYGRKYARECIQCGKCEEVCTQHIPIREHLKEAVELFNGGAQNEEKN